jgi:hypothetical protein
MKGKPMGILINLILSLVHLFLVATDILFFLILMKMLSYRLQTKWLTAFNSLGKPVVDWFAGQLKKGLCHLSKKTFSERAILLVGMLILMLARLFTVVLFS